MNRSLVILVDLQCCRGGEASAQVLGPRQRNIEDAVVVFKLSEAVGQKLVLMIGKNHADTRPFAALRLMNGEPWDERGLSQSHGQPSELVLAVVLCLALQPVGPPGGTQTDDGAPKFVQGLVGGSAIS